MTSADISLPGGRGHELVVLAASCWMDGLWSHALGKPPAERETATRERCAQLRSAIDRPREDETALRLLDPRLVDATVRQLWRTALGDEQDARYVRELSALLQAIAGASREMLNVRILADAVRSSPPSHREDRAATAGVAQALHEAVGIQALVHMTGPFASEAHALGLMFVLDRMDAARDLPIGLRFDALSGVFFEVFKVGAPPSTESPEGWFQYLEDVARAAGHPVSAATSPEVREALAWDGILSGIADRLRAAPTGPFETVTRGAADRIDAAHVR